MSSSSVLVWNGGRLPWYSHKINISFTTFTVPTCGDYDILDHHFLFIRWTCTPRVLEQIWPLTSISELNWTFLWILMHTSEHIINHDTILALTLTISQLIIYIANSNHIAWTVWILFEHLNKFGRPIWSSHPDHGSSWRPKLQQSWLWQSSPSVPLTYW